MTRVKILVCVIFVTLKLVFTEVQISTECQRRWYNHNSFVCVCNVSHCDFPSTLGDIPPKKFVMFSSDRSSLRMKRQSGNVDNRTYYNIKFYNKVVHIDHKQRFQRIQGWGGSVTDSSGINIMNLSPDLQKVLIKSYFSEKGNHYNLIRTPVGGSDMSVRPYTLDDHPDDVNLKYFSLQKEDYEYKIPLMKSAQIENPQVQFLSSVWSMPAWMKTNNDLYGSLGQLKKQYYQTYADYYIKFLDAYKKYGLNFWMISVANEPLTGKIQRKYNNVYFPLSDSAKWIAENMAPTLAASGYNITFYALDDQRLFLRNLKNSLFKDPRYNKYINAIGVHWYVDFLISPWLLDITHRTFPNQSIIMTEASIGFLPWDSVKLGSWTTAEHYLQKMFENIEHWVTGWIDWNLALNEDGGPSYFNNHLDGTIIVNKDKNEFYKQPLFYMIGHFSKFVPQNSVRIFSKKINLCLVIAFERPDNYTVVQIYNSKVRAKEVFIIDDENNLIALNLSAKSINTIIYRR